MIQRSVSTTKPLVSSPTIRSICLNDIWRLARQKWENAGKPDGDNSRFWQEAEEELLEAHGLCVPQPGRAAAVQILEA